MDCYFCGVYNKLTKEGISSFSIPELGMLYRSIIDDKDEVLISFTSIFLLFEFIMTNPLLFKNVSFLNLKGSDEDVLKYIDNEKSIPKEVKPFIGALASFRMELNRMGIEIRFTKVLKSMNLAFLSISTLKVNKQLMLLLNNMQLEAGNDRGKSWK